MRLNFTPEETRWILAGRKTQAIVPAGADRCPYRPGRVYSAFRNGKLSGLRLRVLSVRDAMAGGIGYKDVRAAGFRTSAEFADAWRATQGKRERVWMVAFAVEADEPRLLLPAARGAGSERGYTRQSMRAMREEPEAVDDSHLDRFSATAHARDTERALSAGAARREYAVGKLRALAIELRQMQGDRSTTRFLREIERKLDRMERS